VVADALVIARSLRVRCEDILSPVAVVPKLPTVDAAVPRFVVEEGFVLATHISTVGRYPSGLKAE
jgi:hypothetical protein